LVPNIRTQRHQLLAYRSSVPPSDFLINLPFELDELDELFTYAPFLTDRGDTHAVCVVSVFLREKSIRLHGQ
jgi:hypothetical protein